MRGGPVFGLRICLCFQLLTAVLKFVPRGIWPIVDPPSPAFVMPRHRSATVSGPRRHFFFFVSLCWNLGDAVIRRRSVLACW